MKVLPSTHINLTPHSDLLIFGSCSSRCIDMKIDI